MYTGPTYSQSILTPIPASCSKKTWCKTIVLVSLTRKEGVRASKGNAQVDYEVVDLSPSACTVSAVTDLVRKHWCASTRLQVLSTPWKWKYFRRGILEVHTESVGYIPWIVQKAYWTDDRPQALSWHVTTAVTTLMCHFLQAKEHAWTASLKKIFTTN